MGRDGDHLLLDHIGGTTAMPRAYVAPNGKVDYKRLEGWAAAAAGVPLG